MYQYPDYLVHYGIPGMKWGVRKQRVTSGKTNRRSAKNSMSEADKKARRRRNAKIAAGVVGVALATYGAYKFKNFVNDTNWKYHDELGQKKVKEFTERYDRLIDKQRDRDYNTEFSKLKTRRNTAGQYYNNLKEIDRQYTARKFAAGNGYRFRSNDQRLFDAADALSSKANKKKHEIWLREFKKQGTDSFPQAVKNTATYYKSHKRKRR